MPSLQQILQELSRVIRDCQSVDNGKINANIPGALFSCITKSGPKTFIM
jgi:hypothetical protein